MGVAPPQVEIAGIVPASRRVLQKVDRAHGEGVAGHLNSGWKNRPIDEGRSRVRPARLEQTGAGQRIVDQMRTLQVESAGSQISHFESCVSGKSFFDGRTPLLNVLRRGVRVKGSEADYRFPQHRRAKIER